MKHKFLLSLVFLLLLIFQTHAQQKTITGTVTNSKDGSPVADASVIAVGEKASAITGQDGTFSLSVSPNVEQLQISYVGFEAQTVAA